MAIKKTIKHVDGVTDVVAKGVINANNEFVGEYKYEGMTYGVIIPLSPSYQPASPSVSDESLSPTTQEQEQKSFEERQALWIKASDRQPVWRDSMWRRIEDKNPLDHDLISDSEPEGLIYKGQLILFEKLEWLNEDPNNINSK